ncbi:MAG: hypothetical protein IJT68_09630 [Lentisphaeria bacterium]|nr:hypothetical protein [Lentisphaeria bacterium]
MTTEEKKEIADIVIQAMTQGPCNTHSCPLFDAETIAVMRSFADAVKTGKKAAMKAFITLSVGALITAICAGIKEFLNKP